jgi:hypothetical protein
LILNGGGGANIVVAQDKSIERRLDSYIASLPDPFSGTILIVVGDSIRTSEGYGMANIEYGIPNSGNTKHAIGSVPKPFSAIPVHGERGKQLSYSSNCISTLYDNGKQLLHVLWELSAGSLFPK